MSASQPAGAGEPAAAGGAADPSMEDILASIRRILSEDEAAAGAAPSPAGEPAEPAPGDDDVLALDDSMLVEEPAPEPEPEAPPPPPAPAPPPVAAAAPFVAEPPAPEPPASEPPASEPLAPEPPGREPLDADLVAPAAAAAAASSMDSLVRTLAGRQGVGVYRGGPTLEDIVREEMRPMLKSWLDENLPPMVERLVRVEIERVVGRAVP
jgi:hypothetical protein